MDTSKMTVTLKLSVDNKVMRLLEQAIADVNDLLVILQDKPLIKIQVVS